AALIGTDVVPLLVAAIAISLALTPIISDLGRQFAGKLRKGPPDQKLAGDDADVVIVGMGPRGRALADALAYRGIDYVALEDDAEVFELASADGYDVVFSDPADPRAWEPLSMSTRKAVVVTRLHLGIAEDLQPILHEHFSGLTRIAALGAEHDPDAFRRAGMEPVVAHDADGDLRLLRKVLVTLGLAEEAKAIEAETDEAGPLEPA
ncbi:MAG: NAD-binding protein, partial [Pseudomonadota bacterium]